MDHYHLALWFSNYISFIVVHLTIAHKNEWSIEYGIVRISKKSCCVKG